MIYPVVNNGFQSNTFLLSDETKDCLIIDPGLDEELIEGEILHLELNPLAIIATHGHFDHIAGASFLKNRFSIPFYIHSADNKFLKAVNFYINLVGLSKRVVSPIADITFNSKYERLKIGTFELEVFNFPGHSPGSCAIKYKENLFTGDILFKSGLGFNDFPGQSEKDHKNSLTELFGIFDDLIVYPGHGQITSLKEIERLNEELKAFMK